jgi:hypothetical protein
MRGNRSFSADYMLTKGAAQRNQDLTIIIISPFSKNLNFQFKRIIIIIGGSRTGGHLSSDYYSFSADARCVGQIGGF